jgi:hypothetical protein
MQTQAYFSNIRDHIAKELSAATQSIYVAVAWFTDKRLFRILCDKASEGLTVQLIIMDDDITRTYGLNYEMLEQCGGKVYMVDGGPFGNTMHNKFCVVDGVTTITGSYNWSMKAQSNHENITITWENDALASMFEDEFRRIKVRYHGKDPLKPFDAVIICKRLQIIDNLIQLSETEQIESHVIKIREFQLTGEVESIVSCLVAETYDVASQSIKDYLVRINAVSQFYDSDLEQLKWEIKYLEIEIVSLETEKSTIQKIISDFIHSYNIAFGELLLEILRIKREKLQASGRHQKDEAFRKAEQEYKEYEKEYTKTKTESHFDLNDQEKEDLKKKYRKACTLCHPDKFTDEATKEKAHAVFVALQHAYEKNDLKRVSEILENLENGNFDISDQPSVNSRQQLMARVEQLRKKLSDLSGELLQIRNDKTYRDVVAIKNMKTFFEEEKERLENELNSLKNEQ